MQYNTAERCEIMHIGVHDQDHGALMYMKYACAQEE